MIDKARAIVAHQLEVSEDDLEFANGTFSVKGSPDRSMGIKAVAFQAHAAHNLPDGMEPGLEETAVFDPPNFSWPGGAHAAVVEVDTETGDTRLLRYVAVDDVGNPVNPQIIDGQVHGGVTQGIAAALYEEGAYDEEGNLLTTTMTTYLVPSAAELPSFETDRIETRADNPLGVKGVGETGTIAAAPAVDQRRRRRALAPRRHRRPDAGHARASLGRDPGGEVVIPAAFDYEVAESAEHAIELLGRARGREAPRRRALAPAGDEAPPRTAVARSSTSGGSPTSRTCARTEIGSRSGR